MLFLLHFDTSHCIYSHIYVHATIYGWKFDGLATVQKVVGGAFVHDGQLLISS